MSRLKPRPTKTIYEMGSFQALPGVAVLACSRGVSFFRTNPNMLQYLERQTKLTGNQRRIITAAVLGDMLEFFDYFLIGFVVAFIAGPWKLTFGQSAVILFASGFGAIFGSVFYGWLADKIGRRTTFILTVVNFSLATGALAFTPED